MEADKLRECPFCGSAAKCVHVTGMVSLMRAGCTKCGANIEVGFPAFDREKQALAEQRAIAAWNTRPSPADEEAVPCQHLFVNEGPRIPLRYGSAATEICCSCAAWRQVRHGIDRWRPADELAESFTDPEEARQTDALASLPQPASTVERGEVEGLTEGAVLAWMHHTGRTSITLVEEVDAHIAALSPKAVELGEEVERGEFDLADAAKRAITVMGTVAQNIGGEAGEFLGEAIVDLHDALSRPDQGMKKALEGEQAAREDIVDLMRLSYRQGYSDGHLDGCDGFDKHEDSSSEGFVNFMDNEGGKQLTAALSQLDRDGPQEGVKQ